MNKTFMFHLFALSGILAASPAISVARDYIAPGTYGVGAHLHRFVLRDPLTGAPMPGTRYRLFVSEHPIAKLPQGKSVIFGVSDSRGRTATVRMPKRHPRSSWILQPIMGHGNMGESFRLVSSNTNDPLEGIPYILDLKGGYLFCGKSDHDGSTYYIQWHAIQPVKLYTADADMGPADYAWCKRTADAISSLPANVALPDIFRAMLAHYESSKNTLSVGLLERIRQKLLDLAIAGRDSRQFDLALALTEKPDWNHIGYELIDSNWMVERGMHFVEQALAEDPEEPHALDSMGWGLFRLGQPERALTYLERSMLAFKEKGEDNAEARAEVWVHKGEVLWQLGRHAEARLAFKEAKGLDASSEALTETLTRLNVRLDGDSEKEM